MSDPTLVFDLGEESLELDRLVGELGVPEGQPGHPGFLTKSSQGSAGLVGGP
ncbi:hypothetical protein OG381_47145 [Streptomyces sp. NBC_00490]|uniref:hypothetical protein n=1 Tax=Streptomyces sp. NBC_00490 TaxID=2903657 RepID=UPI002E189C8F